MRRLSLSAVTLALLILGGCGGEAIDTGGCDFLFGSPNESTGLSDAVCRPERSCEGIEPFAPPIYEPAAFEALTARTLIDPQPLLPASPYEDASLVPTDTSGFCTVMADTTDPDSYRLQTFPDRNTAAAEGGVVTHAGACGACSSLQDLAVYLSVQDLGSPVRKCALIEFGDNPGATLDCITDLGFTRTCAQIWAFNSTNTRGSCLVDCLETFNEPNHLPDGSLNACLSCDEENSGPVFKAVAGRTRRNSGIPSAICRPGEDVEAVFHNAYP